MQNRFPCASTRITLARAQEKPGNWPKIKRMNSLCPLHYSFLLGILDFFPPLGKGWEVGTEVIILGIEDGWVGKVTANKHRRGQYRFYWIQDFFFNLAIKIPWHYQSLALSKVSQLWSWFDMNLVPVILWLGWKFSLMASLSAPRWRMWCIYIPGTFQIIGNHTSHEKGALPKVGFYSDLKIRCLET